MMKGKVKVSICVAAIVVLLMWVGQLWWPTPESRLREGDIVMRGTNPELLVTGSIWTHCGVLHRENGTWYVYEAHNGVEKTAWRKWRRKEKPYYYRVLRYDDPLTESQQKQIRQRINRLMNRRYDRAFGWSDDKLYCSELVWKAYEHAGIRLSEPRKGTTFVAYYIPWTRKMMLKRGVNPQEVMVPPGDIARSRKLHRVW